MIIIITVLSCLSFPAELCKFINDLWDFPGGLVVKNPRANGRMPMFDPWVRKIPWRRKWQPTTVRLPGESQGQRSLAGYSLWGRKESDTTEQLTYRNIPIVLHPFGARRLGRCSPAPPSEPHSPGRKLRWAIAKVQAQCSEGWQTLRSPESVINGCKVRPEWWDRQIIT